MERQRHQTTPAPGSKPRCCEEPAVDPCLEGPSCPRTCEELPREIIRYYNGRFLAARDLRDERDFLLGRLRLANRLYRGWGTICGLEVNPHPRPECADGWVVVAPGLALDCCGREIILCERTALPLPEPVPPVVEPCPPEEPDEDDGKSGPTADGPEPKPGPDHQHQQAPPEKPHPAKRGESAGPPPEWGPYLVCLRYTVRPIEPGPVLLDDACCDPDEMAYNRLREEPLLEILPFDPEKHAGCWPWPPGGATGGGECPPCEPEQEDTDCFAPDCPCDDCVPLALLTYDPERGLVIDTSARRRVRSTLATLTRIAHINWPHGGRLSSHELAEDLKGRLEICFSRPLMDPGPRPGTGIGRATFEVTYTESQGDFEILPAARRPWVSRDGCKAVFEIADWAVRRLRRSFIRIRVLGDFVLDVHGNPVDADFLGATLPTGDGIAGGTFESWFWVGDDESATEEARR